MRWTLGWVGCVALASAACGGGKESKPTEQPYVSKDPPTVAYADTPSPPDGSGAPTIKLPAKAPPIGAALGKPRTQVDKIVGPSEPIDPGRLHTGYGGEGGVAVRVEYELGVAGMFGLSFALDDSVKFSPENLGAIRRWAGVDGDASTTTRVQMGDTGVEIWKTEAMQRSDERKRVGYLLGDYLKRINAGSGHARGEVNTTLLIRVTYKAPCNPSILAKYRADFEADSSLNLAKLGFRKLQCGTDGPELAVR